MDAKHWSPSAAHLLGPSPSPHAPWCRHPFLGFGGSYACSIFPWDLSDAVWRVGTLEELEEIFSFPSPALSSSLTPSYGHCAPNSPPAWRRDGPAALPGFPLLLKGNGPHQCPELLWQVGGRSDSTNVSVILGATSTPLTVDLHALERQQDLLARQLSESRPLM